jgi:hypothetical protein
MSKLAFVVGVGAGYVLGTRAGREQYDKLVAQAHDILADPTVRQVTDAAKAGAGRLADEGRALVGEKTDQVSKQLGTTNADEGSTAGA